LRRLTYASEWTFVRAIGQGAAGASSCGRTEAARRPFSPKCIPAPVGVFLDVFKSAIKALGSDRLVDVMAQKVTLFVPCFVDQLVPQVAMDVVAVLRRMGYAIDYPEEQTCCGQPAFNAGFWNEARPVAERFVRVFRHAETIVCPSGSCTTMVRSFYPELLRSSAWREDAVALGKRLFEFSEFLVDVAHVTDVGASFPYRVTYHDSCHLLRELRIREQPRQLLRQVRGLELIELPYSEECCGFGGAFSFKFPEIAGAMGDVKANHVESTGADYVTACDSSCLLHVDGILRRKKSKAKTIHIAQILAAQQPVGTPQRESGIQEVAR
jgi:L-lactate dehydrogenase complex protein LldE